MKIESYLEKRIRTLACIVMLAVYRGSEVSLPSVADCCPLFLCSWMAVVRWKYPVTTSPLRCWPPHHPLACPAWRCPQSPNPAPPLQTQQPAHPPPPVSGTYATPVRPLALSVPPLTGTVRTYTALWPNWTHTPVEFNPRVYILVWIIKKPSRTSCRTVWKSVRLNL